MTEILRETIEADLLETLESEYGLPFELIDPDGVTYTKSANDATADLVGQILFDTIVEDPETGQQIVVHNPVVSVRRTSLTRVPQNGEKWIVKIPTVPNYTAAKTAFMFERAIEDGGSIGFIQLYLVRAVGILESASASIDGESTVTGDLTEIPP
jgi:hypothetical protein